MDPRQSIDDILDEPVSCVGEYLIMKKVELSELSFLHPLSHLLLFVSLFQTQLLFLIINPLLT